MMNQDEARRWLARHSTVLRTRVGFTATRNGLTRAQHEKLDEVFRWIMPTEFHHGCCIGGDVQAHDLLRHLSRQRDIPRARIVLHPPDEAILRAFCTGDESREPAPYMIRNQAIVDETVFLIACPESTTEHTRSGTWSTVRKARRRRIPILLVLHTGETRVEVPGETPTFGAETDPFADTITIQQEA